MSCWDYRTTAWRVAHPEAKLSGRNDLAHPRRLKQKQRTLTVLIDGGDPFRGEVPEIERQLVLDTIEACPRVEFVVETAHLISAKFLIRKMSKAQVDHALRWRRHKDPEKRNCPAALDALERAQRPFLPNLLLLPLYSVRASNCALRLGVFDGVSELPVGPSVQ